MATASRALCATAAALTGMFAFINAPVSSADGVEDYFLNELYKTHQKWFWPFGEQYIIGEAHRVCVAWAANTPYNAEVDALAAEKQWTHRNTRYFIALSTATFCTDRYVSTIPPEARLPDGK